MSLMTSRILFNERKPSSTLTAEKLRELLRYDPVTGNFFWLVTQGGRSQAGQRAGKILKANRGYRQIVVLGIRYRAHRLAWLYMTGEWPRDVIDHIDGDTDNNRWANLRAATQAQNMANQRLYRKNNTSGHRGVFKVKGRESWRVRIRVRGEQISCGCYPTFEAAKAAYLQHATRLYGEFARTAEFPDAPWIKGGE